MLSRIWSCSACWIAFVWLSLVTCTCITLKGWPTESFPGLWAGCGDSTPAYLIILGDKELSRIDIGWERCGSDTLAKVSAFPFGFVLWEFMLVAFGIMVTLLFCVWSGDSKESLESTPVPLFLVVLSFYFTIGKLLFNAFAGFSSISPKFYPWIMIICLLSDLDNETDCSLKSFYGSDSPILLTLYFIVDTSLGLSAPFRF